MSAVADVFYLAVGSAAAAVAAALVAGAGTQIACDHRAFIAGVWRSVTGRPYRAVRTLTHRLMLGAASYALTARLHAAMSGSHTHRRTPGGIYR